MVRRAPLALLLLFASSTGHALERYPTSNRLGISLGFGFGSASLSGFHKLLEANVPNPPESGFQINAEVGFRYYFPYYILAQVGYDAVYNRVSGPVAGVELATHQLAMEVPILVGGYYPFLGRLYVFGAIGPSPFFYARSWLDPGTDSKADDGVGFQALIGAEYLVTRGFAFGLELRYRYLKASNLRELNTGGQYPGGPYDLDLSGISLGFTIRAFAF